MQFPRIFKYNYEIDYELKTKMDFLKFIKIDKYDRNNFMQNMCVADSGVCMCDKVTDRVYCLGFLIYEMDNKTAGEDNFFFQRVKGIDCKLLCGRYMAEHFGLYRFFGMIS